MITHSIASLLGFTNAARMMMETFASCSNVILTDNPEYTFEDFQSFFPIFKIAEENEETCDPEEIPIAVFWLFKAMADSAIKYDRYFDHWKYLMSLYIAHFLALYLQTQHGDASAENALRGSLPMGIASSKSVDGLSVSYDFMGMAESMQSYGTWALTIYGQQLITLTRTFGHAGMWVNG